MKPPPTFTIRRDSEAWCVRDPSVPMVFHVELNAYDSLSFNANGVLNSSSQNWKSLLRGWERGPVVYPGDVLVFDSMVFGAKETVHKVRTQTTDFFFDGTVPAGIQVLVVGVRRANFGAGHRSNGKFGWVQQVYVPMFDNEPPKFFEIAL